MGGEWSASRPGRPLPPGKGPAVPIVQEAGWAPEPVWTQSLEEKSSAPAGDRTPIARSVVGYIYLTCSCPLSSDLGLCQGKRGGGVTLTTPPSVGRIEYFILHEMFVQRWILKLN
jgi:hypothetical protein